MRRFLSRWQQIAYPNEDSQHHPWVESIQTTLIGYLRLPPVLPGTMHARTITMHVQLIDVK